MQRSFALSPLFLVIPRGCTLPSDKKGTVEWKVDTLLWWTLMSTEPKYNDTVLRILQSFKEN